MADVISVTLEANISSRTNTAFKNFDRLVKGIGKSVLNFRKHTDATDTSIKKLNTSLNRKTGFSAFDKKLVSSAGKVKTLRKEVSLLRGDVLKLSKAFQTFAGATSAPLTQANQNLQAVRRSATQTAAAYRHARQGLAGLQRQAGRGVNGVRMPNVNFYGGGGGGGGARSNRGRYAQGGPNPGNWVRAGMGVGMVGMGMKVAGKSMLDGALGILNAGSALDKAVISLTSRLEMAERWIVPAIKMEAKTLSRRFGILPSEILTMYEEAAAMGASGLSLKKSGLAISTLARTGEISGATAAKGLGMILATYGFRDNKNNIDFGKATNLGYNGTDGKAQGTGLNDVLTFVGDAFSTDVAQLLRAFEYSGASFKAAGIDVVRSAVYLGAASDVGRVASKGGRDMAEIIGRASRSDVGEKIKDRLGVSLIDAQGNLKESLAVTAEIMTAIDSLTEGGKINQAEVLSMMREFFGEQGLKAFGAFTASIDKSKDILNKINTGDAKGSALRKADEKSTTYEVELTRLKGEWESFSESILGHNKGVISGFLNLVSGTLSKLTELINNNPNLARVFFIGTVAAGAFLVVSGSILATLGAIGFAVGGIGAGLEVWSMLVGGTNILGKFGMLSRTIAKARGGITGLIGSMPILGRVGTVFGSVLGRGAGGLAARFAALRVGALALGGAMGPVGWILTGISLVAMKFWQPIKAFIGGMYDGFANILQPSVTGLRVAFAELWAAIQPGIREFMALISPMETSNKTLTASAQIGKIFGTIIGAVFIPALKMATFAIKVFTTGARIAGTAWNVFATILEYSPVGLLIKAFRVLRDVLTSWFSTLGSWADSFMGFITPILNAFTKIAKLAKFMNPAYALSHPLELYNTLTGKEEVKPDNGRYFKSTLADTYMGARNKLITGGAVDESGGLLNSLNSGNLNKMIDSGTVTVRDLLAVREGQGKVGEYQKINLTPEQLGYINEVEKILAKPENQSAEAQERILNSAPTINITVNGNVGGTPEAIGEEVQKAVANGMRESYLNTREVYGNDGF